MNFRRFDYVSFRDLLGDEHTGRIVNTFGPLWLIKSGVTYRYLTPIEHGGKIVGYRKAQDFIEYYVRPADIISIVDDPRNKEMSDAGIS